MSNWSCQVEFYFSDSNLPTDEFLMNAVGETNNPVALSIITNFKRMRRFQPYEAVVEALKSSSTLELSGESGKETIKRKIPFSRAMGQSGANLIAERNARTVYAKGFGDESAQTQFDIEAYFAPYGPINAVRLRRDDDKAFKGSVYTEFATEDLAKAFLALDPKPKFKGEVELEIYGKVQ